MTHDEHMAFLAWREYGEHSITGQESNRAIFVAGYRAAEQKFKRALVSAYAKGYGADAVIQIARICDEIIDPSGRLLGEIREMAAKGVAL